jgi:hypothetical protein
MKLVDAEVSQQSEGAPDIARPSRPARRRVYTSLLVTLSVLFGTVGIIYRVFPNRHDEIMTLAINAHRGPGAFELEAPSGMQIRAWSLGLFGESAPWPDVNDGLVPIGASALRIFKRDVAIVRYELDGQPLTVVMLRKRNPVPRTLRHSSDGLYAVSWGGKRFNTIAVGPEAAREVWGKRLGVP